MKQWSTYQQQIFTHVADPTSGSAIVRAVAGAGKSTTIVEAISRAPRGTVSIFLAFNKAIAEELKARNVNARTFHSLTFGPVIAHSRKLGGSGKVDTNKLRGLIRVWPAEQQRLYGTAAQKLVGLGRNDGIGCLLPDLPDTWRELADRHDIVPDTEEGTEAGLIAAAQMLLQQCNSSPEVDFDDMLYRTVLHALPLPKHDLVMVDEAQDTNRIQRALLRAILAPKGRIIAVGDKAQAIYGFRGADSSAMDLIAHEFDAVELPLTVTYRCARSIVNYAAQWSPLQAAPAAPEGQVVALGDDYTLDLFQPATLTVCRTNAPLLKLAYALIRARRPVFLMGREIGTGLTSLINKLQPKGIDGLLEKLAAWEAREVAKAMARQEESKAEQVTDKADSIRVIIDGLPENERTVPRLCQTIESLFAGGPEGKAILASIHKSKGLEADHVIWLERSKCPSKWARQPWQQEQEANLCYVAATRAKSRLTLID